MRKSHQNDGIYWRFVVKAFFLLWSIMLWPPNSSHGADELNCVTNNWTE